MKILFIRKQDAVMEIRVSKDNRGADAASRHLRSDVKTERWLRFPAGADRLAGVCQGSKMSLCLFTLFNFYYFDSRFAWIIGYFL